jgi:uncharacterized protein YndB with AHSA1/START domain
MGPPMVYLKWAGIVVLCLILLVGLVALIGFALPQGHVASRSVTINRPMAEVWTTITKVDEFPAWRESVEKVQVLGRNPLRWREDGSDGPLTFEAIEVREPSRLVTEIADKNLPFGGRWVYELKPITARGGPERTEITITEHGEVYNPVFRFVSRFIMGHAATLEGYLSDLQKRLP